MKLVVLKIVGIVAMVGFVVWTVFSLNEVRSDIQTVRNELSYKNDGGGWNNRYRGTIDPAEGAEYQRLYGKYRQEREAEEKERERIWQKIEQEEKGK